MANGIRDKLLIALLVPVLVFPVVVIAAGGDLDLIWQELHSFARGPLVMTAYAGQVSPTMTASPGMMTPGPGGVAQAPLLTRWAMISASIILALVALWAINRRLDGDHTRR